MVCVPADWHEFSACSGLGSRHVMTTLMSHIYHVSISPSSEHPPRVCRGETALSPTLSPFVAYVGREPDDISWWYGVRKMQGPLLRGSECAAGGRPTLLSSKSVLCLSSLLKFSDFCSFCLSSVSSSCKKNVHTEAGQGQPHGPLLLGEVTVAKASGT